MANTFNHNDKVVITDDGSVGIGKTSSISAPLNVFSASTTNIAIFENNGTSIAVKIGDSSNSNYANLVLTSNSGNAQFWKAGTAYTGWGGALALNIYNSNGAIAFHPNDIANAMFINTSGNVGIGTTSPSAKFVVNNNGGTGSTFYVDAGNIASTQTLFEHTGSNTPVPFAISKSGYSGNSAAFGILYLDMAHNVTGGGANMYFTLRDSNSNLTEYGGLGATIVTNTDGSEAGRLNFYTTNGGSERQNRMVISPDGSVGIGTTSPGYKLDVSAAARALGVRIGRDFSISNRATVRLDSYGDYPADILFGQDTAASQTDWNGVYWSISSRNSGASTSAGNKFTIWRGSGHASPNNSESQFLTITPDLKMGIGTTGPNYMLDVNGEGQIGYINFEYNSNYAGIRWKDSGYNLRWKIGNDGPSGNWLYLYDYAMSTSAFTFKPNGDMSFTPGGNVSIGSTSSGAKLTVVGSAISISNGWTGTHDILFVGGSPTSTGAASGTAARIRSTASAPGGAATGDLLFTVNSGDTFVDALYIKETGNIGINQNSPTSPLHITANVTLTEDDIPRSFALQIDSNHSGTDTATGDREQGAIYIDVDSSTTGGDTANEHRVYGVYADVRASGDSDDITGFYGMVEQNSTAGTTTWVRAGNFAAVSDGGTGASVGNTVGVYGLSSAQDATPVTNAYGVFGHSYVHANRTGETTNVIGGAFEAEFNNESGNIGSAIGVWSYMDFNAGETPISNAYHLYISESGTSTASNHWAIYSGVSHPSYLNGSLGIGTSSPSYKLHVEGGGALIKSNVNDGSAILTIRSSDNYGYSFARSNATGFLEFDGNQSGYVGYVFKNGKVGIGTTSPTAQLTIDSSSTPQLLLRNPSGTNSKILLEDNGGGTQNASITFDQAGQNTLTIATGYQSTTDDNKIHLAPAGYIGLTVRGGTGSSNGNVGIGTTSPSAKLHVNGSLRLDSSTGNAPTSSQVAEVNSAYGEVDTLLGGPAVWLRINVGGTVYVFPGYDEGA